MKPLFFLLLPFILFYISHSQIYSLNTEEIKQINQLNTIQTVGTASASLKPDQVYMSFSISSIDQTASEALADNNEILHKAFMALKMTNLTDDEIGSSSFSIGPAYDNIYNSNGTSTTVFRGYQVSSSLNILTQKIELAGSLVDAVISQGVKQVNSIEFQISKEKKKQVQDELLTQAVKNAKHKADLALEPLKAKVKGLVKLDLDNNQPQPHYNAKIYSRANALDVGGRTNLYASNQDVYVQVNAEFEIGQGIDVASVFP